MVLAERTHLVLVLWTCGLFFGIGPSRACASGAFALGIGRVEDVHRFLPSEHVLCVGPLDVWSVLASVLPERAQFARVTHGCGVTGCKSAKAVVSERLVPRVFGGLSGAAEIAWIGFILIGVL